jgi:hypothetical protein
MSPLRPASSSANFGNFHSSKKNISININIDNSKQIYTVFDEIRGTATITAQNETRFDDIDIELIGNSHAFVERVAHPLDKSGRTDASHKFLKLKQPNVHQLYPADRVLRANQAYTFPFLFTVPIQLLAQTCRHEVSTSQVRQAHLKLPPSFGDKELVSEDLFEDMSPDMSSIGYCIVTKLSIRNARQ